VPQNFTDQLSRFFANGIFFGGINSTLTETTLYVFLVIKVCQGQGQIQWMELCETERHREQGRQSEKEDDAPTRLMFLEEIYEQTETVIGY